MRTNQRNPRGPRWFWFLVCYGATHRPTQSIMYVPLQVNRFQKSILLIVQYKYLKSRPDILFSESDPPHKIMRHWFLLLNLVGVFMSTRPRWSVGNVLYHSCTSFEGACRGDKPFNIFAWFTGAGRARLYFFLFFLAQRDFFQIRGWVRVINVEGSRDDRVQEPYRGRARFSQKLTFYMVIRSKLMFFMQNFKGFPMS